MTKDNACPSCGQNIPCKHDFEWTDVEGFGTVGICKKCGVKHFDD